MCACVFLRSDNVKRKDDMTKNIREENRFKKNKQLCFSFTQPSEHHLHETANQWLLRGNRRFFILFGVSFPSLLRNFQQKTTFLKTKLFDRLTITSKHGEDSGGKTTKLSRAGFLVKKFFSQTPRWMSWWFVGIRLLSQVWWW